MTIRKQTRMCISGLSEAAKKLGRSTTHLHYVITGERKSKRLEARARELGIRFPRVRRG